LVALNLQYCGLVAVASVNLPFIRFYFKRRFGRTMHLTIITIITPLTLKQ
jgi:hypothetical protein